MGTPSIRECMDRLAAMGDTTALVDDLGNLENELELEYHTTPLSKARHRLIALDELCRQLLANIRNFGTPPSAPPRPPKEAATSIHAAPKAPPVAQPPATARKPFANRPSYANVVPPTGQMTMAMLMAELGRNDSWVHARISASGFPKAIARQGHVHLWDRAEVEAWKAAYLQSGVRLRRPLGVSA